MLACRTGPPSPLFIDELQMPLPYHADCRYSPAPVAHTFFNQIVILVALKASSEEIVKLRRCAVVK
jgi:hypothetical protein